ncbi:MAG: PqqD family protein [Actinomycetota bacterium]|nr:PqqD family protein [Actinomycetota bacterium]
MTDDREFADDLVPQPAPFVRTAFLDDEAVLYLVHETRAVLLNPTAAVVWAAIDGETSVAEIAALLAETFHAQPATVRDDVELVLRHLMELGALARST